MNPSIPVLSELVNSSWNNLHTHTLNKSHQFKQNLAHIYTLKKHENKLVRGTISVILSKPPCKNYHSRFTIKWKILKFF